MKSVRDAWESINHLSLNFIEEQIPIWAIALKEDSHPDTKNKMIGYVGYTGWNKKHYRAEMREKGHTSFFTLPCIYDLSLCAAGKSLYVW